MNWDGLTSNAFWYDEHRLLFNKDSRRMIDLADESVQMCVTSPPYWGLRKYAGLPDLIWGGDGSCEHNEMIPSPEPSVPKAGNKQRDYIQDGQYTGKHKWQHDQSQHDNLRFRGEHSIVGNEKNREIHPVHSWGIPTIAIQGNNSMVRGKDETDSGNFAIPKFKDTDMRQSKVVAGAFCSLCGAWQGQLGLEPTPELYIEHLVEICREIRRVLRSDGVFFLNIGDSYAGSGKGQNGDGTPGKSGNLQRSNKGTQIGGLPVSRFDKWNSDTLNSIQVSHDTPKASYKGLKPKDLCLIPFRLAIALQEDGWWVRSVIIWNKPNPMPESVRDRPSESHEYILHLTKSARYYWDAEAVREQIQPSTESRYRYDVGFHDKRDLLPKEEWIDDRRAYGYPQKRGFKTKHGTTFGEQEQFHGQDINSYPSGRNMRSVWTFSTQNYKEAHFATFPEELVRRCVLAATPEVGCCSKCGKPWVRIVDKSYKVRAIRAETEKQFESNGGSRPNMPFMGDKITTTIGWQPQCKCQDAEKIPSIVLDPFAGSGTTLKVAAELGRRAIGYELSPDYCSLIIERNHQAVII